ncbi:MAG: multicopper oxidase family protein [Geminicoccaceae bacterium]
MHRSTRRDFLAGATTLATGVLARPSFGTGTAPISPLAVETRTIDVSGRAAKVFKLAQPDGTPGLTLPAGGTFRVDLTNRLAKPTLVHWHGLTPPQGQDGVPVLQQQELAPGSTYSYDFALTKPGTNWMHSHVGFQEQQLLAAPLIVTDPAETGLDEQPVVILFHDFTFRDPAEILSDLGGVPDMPGMQADSMPAMHHGDAASSSMTGGMAHGAMSSGDMKPDLNDVAYDAFLANDRTLDDPEVVRVALGGRIRLRLINGASASNMHVDLGMLEGTLIAVDGVPIVPVAGTSFPLGIAQRLDISLVLPRTHGAWPLLAQVEGLVDQTGVILATAEAAVRKVSPKGGSVAPQVGFDLEAGLRARDPLPPRAADRKHAVTLGGAMAPYLWTIDGRTWGDHRPLDIMLGERVEIEIRNPTMMAHPMHLHGHHFQVVALDGRRFAGAVRDTVLVPPMQAVTIAFDADNPGRWAFHCHQLYHMATGMFTEVRYQA